MAPSHDVFARPPRPLWTVSTSPVTAKPELRLALSTSTTTAVGPVDDVQKPDTVKSALTATSLASNIELPHSSGDCYSPEDFPTKTYASSWTIQPPAKADTTVFAEPLSGPSTSRKPVFLPRLVPHLYGGSDRFFKQVVRYRYGLDQVVDQQSRTAKPTNLAYRILPPGLGGHTGNKDIHSKELTERLQVDTSSELTKGISQAIPSAIMKQKALPPPPRTRTTSLPSKFQKAKPLPLTPEDLLSPPDPFDYTPPSSSINPPQRTPSAKSSFALAKANPPTPTPNTNTNTESPTDNTKHATNTPQHQMQIVNERPNPEPIRELPSIDEVFRRLGIADEMNVLRRRLGLPPLSTSRPRNSKPVTNNNHNSNLRARLNVLLAAGRRGDETWEKRRARVKKFGDGSRPSPLRVEV